jgi:hypothetical protein
MEKQILVIEDDAVRLKITFDALCRQKELKGYVRIGQPHNHPAVGKCIKMIHRNYLARDGRRI